MNKKKYKNLIYKTRPLTDLKDMVRQSVELYGPKDAYLTKDVPGGEYRGISFDDFGQDIDAMGTALLARGLKDARIAVVGENSYKWVVSYLSVTNGTGVVVPLDKELPTNEMEGLIERAEVRAIFTSAKLEKKLAEMGKKTLKGVDYIIRMTSSDAEHIKGPKTLNFDDLIAEGRKLMAEGDRSFIDAKIEPHKMCSLLFTSGTTGTAKGVMLSHRNIVQNVVNMSKYVDIGIDGIGLSVLPMHHTFEMTCHIMTSIYQGLTVCICEGLKYIMKNMAEAKCTHMLAVPLIFEQMHKKIMKQAEQKGQGAKIRKAIAFSHKHALYNHPEVTKRMFSALHTATGGRMRLFISGGAAIDPQVIEDFEAMGVTMIQGYGMTENAPIIAVNRDVCSKADAAGFPMQGTEVRIVDADENGVGEVICRGPSVMLGYYNNPEETAEVLRDGWLYTGDYGMMDSEGYLHICGRKKNVIVTKNGKNVFPEDVEYYLLKSDYIEEVLVMGVEDPKTGDTVIKASIYPNYPLIQREMGSVSEEELQKFFKGIVDHVNDEMPIYKRVKRITIRSTEFEKTTTRKIKRFAKGNITEGQK